MSVKIAGAASSTPQIVRKRIRLTGVVQGVGFRPYLYRLARRHHLGGRVWNAAGQVELEVEGEAGAVAAFLAELPQNLPALAVLTDLTWEDLEPQGERQFVIDPSREAAAPQVAIPADVALCADCAAEILDPADRRYRYPFTNCTNCGPRFTIIRHLPYDRRQTAMAVFPMCPDCRREYDDPADRRFHAEPTACPVCGPRIWLEEGEERWEDEVITRAAALLRQGRILALKGLGGFHLACDATQEEAVLRLRQGKGRQDKPLALMVRDLEVAESLCYLGEEERRSLTSPASPIVLARRRAEAPVAPAVAPGNKYLGLMLPYTPLHLLLLQEAPPILVMTSGNRSEEPLAYTNEEARERLGELADAFLAHNREIVVPCDDSVLRWAKTGPIILRRARGLVPGLLELPVACPEVVLGVGAQEKNTFCLGWGQTAALSQHLGDLDQEATLDYFRLAVNHWQQLTDRRPSVVAHDLHPAYASTRFAQELAGVQRIGVQHHHAHIAACLAENQRLGPCLGLAFDGTGFGPDGTVWGGEILRATLADYQRVGHLTPVRLPGGEAAIREPGRMAWSYLVAAFGAQAAAVAATLGLKLAPLAERILRRQLATGWQAPWTTSVGRLFDAVAAALHICRRRTYEGQPAVELEMAALEDTAAAYPLEQLATPPNQLDGVGLFRLAVEDYLSGTPAPTVAARFHATLAAMITALCRRLREQLNLNLVALSGGVWQNAILLELVHQSLTAAGFEVLGPRQVPPNDGGLALGQVAVAAARLNPEVRAAVRS